MLAKHPFAEKWCHAVHDGPQVQCNAHRRKHFCGVGVRVRYFVCVCRTCRLLAMPCCEDNLFFSSTLFSTSAFNRYKQHACICMQMQAQNQHTSDRVTTGPKQTKPKQNKTKTKKKQNKPNQNKNKSKNKTKRQKNCDEVRTISSSSLASSMSARSLSNVATLAPADSASLRWSAALALASASTCCAAFWRTA